MLDYTSDVDIDVDVDVDTHFITHLDELYLYNMATPLTPSQYLSLLKTIKSLLPKLV
ncbi:hypothetical protein MferCBS31731_004130 [Microsporum ferrugineum]